MKAHRQSVTSFTGQALAFGTQNILDYECLNTKEMSFIQLSTGGLLAELDE